LSCVMARNPGVAWCLRTDYSNICKSFPPLCWICLCCLESIVEDLPFPCPHWPCRRHLRPLFTTCSLCVIFRAGGSLSRQSTYAISTGVLYCELQNWCFPGDVISLETDDITWKTPIDQVLEETVTHKLFSELRPRSIGC